MDAPRFDTLTKTLFALRTRRGLPRSLVITGAAVVFARLGQEDATAACKQQGFKCKKDRDCCTECCKQFGKIPNEKHKCWCRRLRETCSHDVNCCPLPNGMVCRPVDNGIGKNCAPARDRCCLPEGYGVGCQNSCDCCFDKICDDGSCCLPLGASGCENITGFPCCSTYCQYNTCCLPTGAGPCDTSTGVPCCTGNCQDGFCADVP